MWCGSHCRRSSVSSLASSLVTSHLFLGPEMSNTTWELPMIGQLSLASECIYHFWQIPHTWRQALALVLDISLGNSPAQPADIDTTPCGRSLSMLHVSALHATVNTDSPHTDESCSHCIKLITQQTASCPDCTACPAIRPTSLQLSVVMHLLGCFAQLMSPA